MSDLQLKVKAVLETQLLGLFRASLTMPIEHSMDRIKTQMQSTLSIRSPFNHLKEIYKQAGLINGVYAGFSPNFARQLIKHYYRWPMMIFIPNFYKNTFPNSQPIVFKTLTGVSIGVFESFIICPLERLKCYYMTKKSAITKFHWRHLNSELIKFLYTGLQIQTTRQIISWTSFMYWDHKIRYYFKNGDRQQKLSLCQLLASSLLSSISNIIVVHPFDTIKTLVQMESNSIYSKMSLRQAFSSIYRSNGIRGFYSGWQLRVLQFFGSAIITSPAIDYLERQYGQY